MLQHRVTDLMFPDVRDTYLIMHTVTFFGTLGNLQSKLTLFKKLKT